MVRHRSLPSGQAALARGAMNALQLVTLLTVPEPFRRPGGSRVEPDRRPARPRHRWAALAVLLLIVCLPVAVAGASSGAPVIPLAAFPVQPPCWFVDNWMEPRAGGRAHEGVDIAATEGSPVYAVVAGTIGKVYLDAPGLRAGNAIRLVQADGTYFFFAHLRGFATGIAPGVRVDAGAVIGYVGQTGNALAPHLHFEIHPGGGKAINPYPSVKAVDGCSGGSSGRPGVPPVTTVVPPPAPPPPPPPTPAPTPPAPAPPSGGSVVGSAVRLGLIPPVRAVDTRAGVGGTRVPANTTVAFSIAGRGEVPAAPAAALLELFVSSPSSAGTIVAFSCNVGAPAAASVAYGRGQIVGNLVHVGVVDGKVCVRSSAATDVIIDVVAADGARAAAGVTAIAPTRIYDSRSAGGRLAAGEVRAITASGVGGVPPSNGITLTLTAVNAAATGTLKVWPCDRSAPGVPVLVVTQGATASASAVSRVAADGTVCVSSTVATDVVVDVMSAWAIGGASTLRTVTPARIHDTRDAGGKVAAGGVLEVAVAGRGGVGGGARLVSASISVTGVAGRGTVAVWPCGQPRPATAAMTILPGVTSTAGVLVGLGGGRLCLSPTTATHLIVDVTGYAG